MPARSFWEAWTETAYSFPVVSDMNTSEQGRRCKSEMLCFTCSCRDDGNVADDVTCPERSCSLAVTSSIALPRRVGLCNLKSKCFSLKFTSRRWPLFRSMHLHNLGRGMLAFIVWGLIGLVCLPTGLWYREKFATASLGSSDGTL